MTRLHLFPAEVLPGDRLVFHEGRQVVSVELPTAPAVIVTFKTTSGPCYAGIGALQEVERPEASR